MQQEDQTKVDVNPRGKEVKNEDQRNLIKENEHKFKSTMKQYADLNSIAKYIDLNVGKTT